MCKKLKKVPCSLKFIVSCFFTDPYTDPERRRRLSDSYRGVPASDDEDEVDQVNANANLA